MRTYNKQKAKLKSKLKDLCRLCMKADTPMYDIFNVFEDNQDCSLPSKILKCLSIEVKDNSDFPTKLCAGCLKTLNTFAEFWEQCHRTDRKLHQFIDDCNESTLFEEALQSSLLYSDYDEIYKSPENSQLFANDDEDVTPSESPVHIADLRSDTSTNAFPVEDNANKTVAEDPSHDPGGSSGEVPNYDSSELKLFASGINAGGSSNVDLQEVGEINGGGNSVEVQVSMNGHSYIVKVLEQSSENNSDITDEVRSESGKSLENLEATPVPDTKFSYECPHCKDSFENSSDLKTHVKKHGDAKGFMCKYCFKLFSVKGGLVRHERIHSGEKPYQCVHCERSFTQKEVLRRHLLTHTGDKPFKCDSCDKSYTQKEALKMHVKNNHVPKRLVEIMQYQCSMCKKSFCHRSGLSRHQKSHAGKKYPCKNCDKVFTDQSCLKRHTLRVHLSKNPAASVKEGANNAAPQEGIAL